MVRVRAVFTTTDDDEINAVVLLQDQIMQLIGYFALGDAIAQQRRNLLVHAVNRCRCGRQLRDFFLALGQ